MNVTIKEGPVTVAEHKAEIAALMERLRTEDLTPAVRAVYWLAKVELSRSLADLYRSLAIDALVDDYAELYLDQAAYLDRDADEAKTMAKAWLKNKWAKAS